MIVRPDGNGSLLLITQPEHAALSARIIAAWDAAAFAAPASRDAVLFAIAEHDNGWRELDEAPARNPRTSRPYDFMDAPLEYKQDIWPRGVARLAATNAQAGALVAQHGLTVHGHRRGEAGWHDFFTHLEAARERLLSACGAAAGPAREAFERSYDLLYLGDLLSLVFCNQWADPMEARGYRAAFRDNAVVVSPDPFDGREVGLAVAARVLPDRDYASDDDLRSAWNGAAAIQLRGTARGMAALP